MADIESNINLDIDASGALASLKELQRQISVFQTTMAKTGSISNARLSDMQSNLVNNINATGQFTASIQRVKTTTESFTQALEKNKLSMGQYFRYSLGATKTFGKGFKTEFDTIEKVARERVKTLQTQYIKLGRDASGAMQAIAVRPQVLDMKDLGTQTAIAAQKAQLFNQLMQQGSTNLLNFGKNTQWAGRQLMVGFTIPLGIMGAAAAKEFQKIEEQVIRLERVYGDFTTTMADTEQITQQIKDLGSEFTKYGVAVSKTIGLAADAAAMGKTGADLVAQVAEANRLAVLGGVDQAQSLETTISLTNAFGVASDQLAGKINFLNAVENQTVTSIEDLTEAIPKAGPVVQQLGGNVEDLTFFLTAMKEGGINASEGANALKSGLASLINPTAEANDMLAGFGINLQGIVEANKGNVKGIVVDFAKALDTLDPLNRAQAIEQLFGKFQFSRLSTLFQNVIAEGSQASRVLDLTKASAAELASLSERELGRIEASPLFKYQAAIENFKAAIAPIGEEFMKAVTPLINFGTQILEGFNSWSDGAKQFAIIAAGAVGAIGPVLLMTFGLLANGLANIVKGILFVRNGFKGLGGQSNVLTEQLNYMNTEQLEAASISASLNQVHNNLIQTFTAEAGSVRNLAAAYGAAIAQQGAFMGPITTRGGGMKKVGKFAEGGIIQGPGTGTSDSIPAMLSNGEAVISAGVVKKYPGLVNGLIAGKVGHFATAGIVGGSAPSIYGGQERMLTPYTMMAPGNTPGGFGMSRGFLDTPEFAASLKNTLVAAIATESNMRLTSSSIESLAKMADPIATQITQHLRDAEVEMAQSGQSATHISELFQRKEQEIKASIPSPAAGAASAVRKLAYPTDEDIRTGGNTRVPGATINAQTGDVIRRTQYSNRTGTTSAFERRLGAVNSAMPVGVSGMTKAHVVPEDRILLGGKAPLRGGGMGLEPKLQGKAIAYIESASKSIVEKIAKQLGVAVDKVSGAASPAKKFIASASKNIVDGAIKPINDAAPEAQKAGQKLAEKINSGVTQGGRTSRRASTGEFTALPTGYLQGKIDDQKKQQRAEKRAARMASLKSAMSPGKLGMAGMVAGGALSAASMMGGPVGDIAGQLGGPIMAISGVASVLGMIPGPAGLVVAGLAALVGGIAAYNMAVDSARKDGIALAESMSLTKEKMTALSEATGNASATEVETAKRKLRLSNLKTEEQLSYGENFVQGEAGKTFLENAKKQLSAGYNMKEVAKNMSTQLATAVAQGIMSKGQADSIAAALGESLNSKTFTFNAQANLTKILGPNGEDLTKDPLRVVTEITQAKQAEAKSAGTRAGKAAEFNYVGGGGAATATGAALVGGGAIASATGAGAVVGIPAMLAGVTMLAVGTFQWAANQAEVAKYAGQAAASYAEAYSQGVGLIDVINQQYDKLIASKNEQLAAATTEEERRQILQDIVLLEEKRASAIKAQNKTNTQTVANAVDTKKQLGDNAWDSAMKEQIGITYKDDAVAKATATGAYQTASGLANETAQATLELQISSGTLDPDVATTLVNAMTNNEELQTNYVALMKTAGDQKTVDMVSMLSAAGATGTTIETMINTAVSAENPTAEVENIMQLVELATTAQNLGVEIDINVASDRDKLRRLKTDLTDLDTFFGEGGKTSYEVATFFQTKGYEMSKAAQAYYDKLPGYQQKEYVQAYLTVLETIDANSAEGKARLKEWWTNEGGKAFAGGGKAPRLKNGKVDWQAVGKLYAEQQAQQAAAAAPNPAASTAPPPGPVDTSGGGGGGGAAAEPEKPPTSFLDAVVKDIREFTNSTQALTENFQDSMNAIRSASASAFGGLSQQLRGVGVGEDVISIMTGMSKEEWDQYKDQFFNFDGAGNVTGFKADLTAIADKLRTITLGKFVDEQQKSLVNLAAQNKALTTLVGLGMTYANAYKLIEDAALAAAIANAKSADEVRQIIALAEQARKAQSLADASKNVANANATTDATIAGLNALIKFNGALSDTQTAAILADDNLQTMLANFDTLTVDQLKVLNEALQDAADKEALEIKIKMQTKEGMQDLFNEGFNKAMEQFSAKEQEIKIKFKALKDPFEDVVNSFTNQIEDLKNTPGGLDDLEADLQRIGEQEIDINKKYEERYKALDSIAKINERVAAQQRTQLSLAEALSQGDIAAAARVAQEMRASEAAQALVDQREALQKSQELELSNLTATMGLTREQIEARIRDLKRQIFEIEEQQIEPAQRQIELLTRQEELQLNAVTVAGKTKEEWENIKNAIDLARTNSQQYTEAINLALVIVQDLQDAWKEIEKPKQTIHTIIERRISELEAAKPVPAPAPVASTAPAPAADYHTESYRNDMARRVIRGEFGNGQARRNALGADYQWIQDRVNDMVYHRNGYATGGLVSSYFANGGMTKPMFAAKGTDTVPAMLTPGEFVVRKWAVDRFGVDNLKAINQGNFGSGSVYNYNMSVNVRSDANPDEIARTVMAQIKRVDAQRVRGNRF